MYHLFLLVLIYLLDYNHYLACLLIFLNLVGYRLLSAVYNHDYKFLKQILREM